MEGQFPIIIVNEQNLDQLSQKLYQLSKSVYKEVMTQNNPEFNCRNLRPINLKPSEDLSVRTEKMWLYAPLRENN